MKTRKKNRLISILKTLSPEEMIRLEEMIYSPYFNKDPKCIELWKVLKTYAPEFDSPNLYNQQLSEQLFPDKKKTASTLSAVMSKLLGLINEHFALEELSKRKYYKRYLTMKAHLKRDNKLPTFV